MRNTPIELILLEIAKGLQTLTTNPDLSKLVTDTYGLAESEKAKAEEARAYIAQADTLRAELQAKADALADVEARIATAEAIEAQGAAKLKEIASAQDTLAAQQAQLEQEKQDFAADKAFLDKREEAVKQRELAVADAEDAVAATRADLKQRAENLKAQTEGL